MVNIKFGIDTSPRIKLGQSFELYSSSLERYLEGSVRTYYTTIVRVSSRSYAKFLTVVASYCHS